LKTTLKHYSKPADEATRADILTTSNELIDSKVERGHISKEDAFVKKRIFAENYALNRFNLLTPEQQVQELKPKQKGKETYFEKTNSWTDAIPPEKKVALLDRAKDQIRINQERIKAESERIAKQQTYNAKNNIINQINQGEELSSISDQDWLALNDKDKKAVRQLYMRKQGLGSSNPIEEDTAFYKYQDLYADNPKAMAEIDPLEIEISVSPEKVAEVKKWQADAFKGVKLPASQWICKEKLLTRGLNEIKINPNQTEATPFKQRFYEEIEAFEEVNKKQPTAKDLEDIKDSLIVQASFSDWFGFSSEKKRMYQVDKDDLKDIVVSKEDSDRIVEEFRQETGEYPSRDEIKAIYLRQISETK
jgi:hypothetical protein